MWSCSPVCHPLSVYLPHCLLACLPLSLCLSAQPLACLPALPTSLCLRVCLPSCFTVCISSQCVPALLPPCFTPCISRCLHFYLPLCLPPWLCLGRLQEVVTVLSLPTRPLPLSHHLRAVHPHPPTAPTPPTPILPPLNPCHLHLGTHTFSFKIHLVFTMVHSTPHTSTRNSTVTVFSSLHLGYSTIHFTFTSVQSPCTCSTSTRHLLHSSTFL